MNETSQAIHSEAPALFELLSDLGQRVQFPADIPFQAAEARDTELNATIGQITDGEGRPIALPQMTSVVEGLSAVDLDRSFLYSPVAGIDELRQSWREWQRRGRNESEASSLPIVTLGLTHGLALIADLFSGPGRAVAVAKPFWGNYAQTFKTRTGAAMFTAPAYVGNRYNCEAVAEALSTAPAGEPAVAILNLPSNPGGYMPTVDERDAILDSLVRVAEDRPLLVICDDAYQGLVYEEEIPRHSMYWDLAGAHDRLVPVKVDGATKELAFFGGRVGFLTFPFAPDSRVAAAIESKVKCLLRAAVGSPVSMSQMVALMALRSVSLEEEVERVRQILESRSRRLRELLAGLDGRHARVLPFNSGCFALLELNADQGRSSESVRRSLLENYDTGLISIAPNYLRIAFCSIAEESLPELVHRIGLALEDS